MHCRHRVSVGSLARYIGEAMGGPPICHAFTMPWWGRVLEFPPYFTMQATQTKTRGAGTPLAPTNDELHQNETKKRTPPPPTNAIYHVEQDGTNVRGREASGGTGDIPPHEDGVHREGNNRIGGQGGGQSEYVSINGATKRRRHQ